MPKQPTTSPRSWPAEFLQDFEQTGTALWFLLYLLTRVDPRTGCFRAPFERVAEEIGVSVMELKCWLEQLDQEGYVEDESLNSELVVRVEL